MKKQLLFIAFISLLVFPEHLYSQFKVSAELRPRFVVDN